MYVPNERTVKVEIENEMELTVVSEDGEYSK